MPTAGLFSEQLVKQQQNLQLSQQQLDSLELLHMPLPELENYLRNEFTTNPVLEELPPGSAESSTPAEKEEPQRNDEEDTFENPDLASAENWSDELPLPEYSLSDPEKSDRLLELLGNFPAPMPSLQEQLFSELAAAELPPEQNAAALEIISALNDDGFLTVNLADIAMAADADMENVSAALDFVQKISPPGVAARNLAETLALQLDAKGELDPVMAKLLDTGLEDIEKNRLPQLAKKLDISLEELDKLMGKIRSCDPTPGRKFVTTSAGAVTPELAFEKLSDGTFAVRSLRENYRRVIVSAQYEKLYNRPDLSPEDRKYLAENLAKARELVRALEMRESTLLRLGKYIAAKQQEFLLYGVEKLRQLTMRESADALDIAESTVSRAVANKFVSTPYGVFPLKFFFSGSQIANGNAELANRAIMEKLRSLVKNENPASPLSDQQLAELLSSSGVNIARRTVAKYRDILKIPAAKLRKRFS